MKICVRRAVAVGLMCAVLFVAGVARLEAQAADGPVLEATKRFVLETGPLTVRQPAVPNRPFTVVGAKGAILGMQDGSAELWQFPLKFFSGLHVEAEMEGYPVPIDLNAAAAEIEVSPDHSTITYAHAAMTVRQHMFVPPAEAGEEMGGVIVFEVESIRPVTLSISLTPAMVLQWPAPQYGLPSWSWQAMGNGGAYVVATDNPNFFGMIGMANAQPGYVSPYQERPRAMPLVFRVRYDPAKDKGKVFPLLCEAGRKGETNSAAGVLALKERLAKRAVELPAIYARTQAFFDHFFDERMRVSTPDAGFDKAIAWAELAIDKAQVTTAGGETGLIAGWYPSFDSARPGYGWFFGRDTLWSVYAIDSYGDAGLVRTAIEFLVKRQRADGKMMHEFSQSADLLTGEMAWSKFPYEYAAADSTPLYLLAMQDYVRSTGDVEFLKTHWESVEKAYRFERTHDADGDGVYDNSQGTGWVEGWPPKMPAQELYLAALDRDATLAMAELARWVGKSDLSAEAEAAAKKIAAVVDSYRLANGRYAFSKNLDGTFDATQTVYPSVALWWSAKGMAQAEPMLTAWAAHDFETDWGTRAVEQTDKVYDPISYHQGTVWPLFTGWTAMAEYRGGRPLAGVAALDANVQLTWVQDPGAVTELLSGRFYEPLGRSSTHQMWSSAMVLAPAVRGLFGLEPDAMKHALVVHPQLPASWNEARLEHVRVGDALYDVAMKRVGSKLVVTARSAKATVLCLRAQSGAPVVEECREAATAEHRMELPLRGVEVEMERRGPLVFGRETERPRVVEERYAAREMMLRVEAMGGDTVDFVVRKNGQGIVPRVEGGEMGGERLRVKMPASEGFVTRDVTVRW